MYSNIKYPIAIARANDKLKHISEVSSGDICYCFHCKEDMVAINNSNNKVAPHFRHKPNSNCNANYETFIHWLAKEVLSKHLTSIELPQINTGNHYSLSDKTPKIQEKLFSKYKVPKAFHKQFFKSYIVQDNKELKINIHTLEKTYPTPAGKIKVDFVVEDNSSPLFIEPFFTNSIDEYKLKKIQLLDISTISIDLTPFGGIKGYDFNLKQFIEYIKSSRSKYWVHLRESKIQNLLTKYDKLLEDDISFHVDNFEKYNKVQNEIEELQKSMEPLHRQLSKIRNRINEKESVINSILNKIN